MMNSMKKRYGVLSIVIAAVMIWNIAMAYGQTPPVVNPNPTTNNTTVSQNPGLNIHLNNPLKVNTITDAISLFMSIIIRIALPLIIIFFIWAGLSFILARGNPTKIETAKRMFFYTVIGTMLILGAWVITNAIIGTVNVIMS